MIGPTGVGKRKLRGASLVGGGPFIKVEATKFTEVGYVGRDVESIIRDLAEIAVHEARDRHRKDVMAKAELKAEERVITALVGATATAETTKFRQNCAPVNWTIVKLTSRSRIQHGQYAHL